MQKTIEQSAPASFFQRVCAYLLDRMILLIALIPLWVGKLFQPELNLAVLFRFTRADLIGWGIATLYFVLTTRLLGGTFGKLAFRLRVTREDGSKLGFWTILLRETAGRYLSGILCIGYFIALFHPKHKALHDMICDTLVRNVVKVTVNQPDAPVPSPIPVAKQAAEQAEEPAAEPAAEPAEEPAAETPAAAETEQIVPETSAPEETPAEDEGENDGE